MTAGADEPWSPFTAPDEDGGSDTPLSRALPEDKTRVRCYSCDHWRAAGLPDRKFNLLLEEYVKKAMQDYVRTLLAREPCNTRGA